MSSHHDGELWGLASANGKVVTSADDNQVIIWDVENKKKSSSVIVSNEKKQSRKGRASTLSHMAASQCSRAVIYKDDGCLVVAANDGRVHIWDNISASAPCKTLEDSAEWIQTMAFSPDGSMLAVGSHDNNSYIYNTSDWSLKGKLDKHTSYIIALDFCAQSKYMRSNCGGYELLFWDLEKMC